MRKEIIEKNRVNGSIIVTDIDKTGCFFTRVYYGYTVKEAVALFRKAMAENNTLFISEVRANNQGGYHES